MAEACSVCKAHELYVTGPEPLRQGCMALLQELPQRGKLLCVLLCSFCRLLKVCGMWRFRNLAAGGTI